MIPAHPFAEMFPLLHDAELAELVADVRQHGLRDKIKVFDGKILDGRNRYRAAIEAGVLSPDDLAEDRLLYFEPFVPDIDGDPLAFVRSRNIHRRHLTTGQRAYAMSLFEQFRHGGARRAPSEPRPEVQDANLLLENGPSEPPKQETRAELAEQGHVSVRSLASAATVRDHGIDDLKLALRDGQIPVHAAERIAKLSPEEQAKAVQAESLPRGARAIMASRNEPDDSFDYFPTPPWATRALLDVVLKLYRPDGLQSVWEPACGEGHMVGPLCEACGGGDIYATDIFNYGSELQDGVCDFINGPYEEHIAPGRYDWIITNPPFEGKAEAFVLKALELAGVGVAVFVQLRWLETVGRYERIFRDTPPTQIAFFAERVNLCRGRWDPDGSTATAYVWLVWIKGEQPRAPIWIPPGQRERLTLSTDRKRYAKPGVVTPDEPVDIPALPKRSAA